LVGEELLEPPQVEEDLPGLLKFIFEENAEESKSTEVATGGLFGGACLTTNSTIKRCEASSSSIPSPRCILG
jgi:hypothetical protein